MGFYIESADRPLKSRIAASDVEVGTLVIENGSDNVRKVTADTDSRFDGVADNPRSGDHIAYDDEDVTDIGVYLASEDDRVNYGGNADGDRIKVRTAQDNGTDPAPSISDGDVVGFVDDTAVSGTGAEFEGRLVEEGYTDNGATTFDRSSGNFVAVGVAYKDEASSFDAPVRVEVLAGLN